MHINDLASTFTYAGGKVEKMCIAIYHHYKVINLQEQNMFTHLIL